MARRPMRALRIVIAALAVLVVAPSNSLADDFGSEGTPGINNNGVWLIPTENWDVARRALTPAYSTGVSATLNASYSPTDLFASLYTDTLCVAAYEMCVYDSDYGDNGLNGWNSCVGTTAGADPNQTCTQQYVRINLFFSPPAQRIACHELGHGVGLRHSDDQASCMKRSAEGGNSNLLTAHDKGHLNAEY